MDLVSVTKNIVAELGGVMSVVYAVCYIAGLVSLLAAGGLAIRAADPGHRRGERPLAWLWSLLGAVFMFALPTVLSTGGQAFFGESVNTNLSMTYDMSGGQKPLAFLVPLLKVFGVIAVARGLWVFRTLGVKGSYGNITVGRGLALVCAGILLVHMKETVGVVRSLTGLDIASGIF